jgi:drug/metabolite transporter (DMT)-like permease
VTAPVFALGSSLSYGISDFFGGTTSRKIGTLRFIFFSQMIGLVLAAGWVALSGDPLPPASTVAAAAAAGVGLTVGLMAFFQAMVVGKMSVVAPVSATGVILPIAAGIAGGERPGATQAIGIVAAIGGVVLAAHPPGESQLSRAESGLGLALLAAVGTGLFLWGMAPASRHGVPWAMLICRAVPMVALIAVVQLRRISLRQAIGSRTAGRILVTALLSFCGAALYAFATVHGPLVIVAVLGSLYPAVTVLLAYRVLGERLGGAQRVGVAAVLTGIVLLAA